MKKRKSVVKFVGTKLLLSSANGCVNYGTPTLEHTWFQSYSWRYALCSNCHTHLGWFYQSGNDSFYGLILENLEEGV